MLTVSNYHYIRESYTAKYPSIFGITPKQFYNQLKLLKNEGSFITPQDLVNDLDKILSSSENFLFITFDDGLKEQYVNALPILDQLNTSDFEANYYIPFYRYMMAAPKIEVREFFFALMNKKPKTDHSEGFTPKKNL